MKVKLGSYYSNIKYISILIFSLSVFFNFQIAGIKDSGGSILPDQAAFDVLFYDLNLKIDPNTESISGYTIVEAKIINNISQFILHLHDFYTISEVFLITNEGKFAKTFSHDSGLLKIPHNAVTEDIVKFEIHYSGKPSIWCFQWNGEYNISELTCEMEGADVWIPCKDHPSDEPDSVSINITIPSNLVCISNGIDRGKTEVDNDWTTYHWFVSNPINNYNITYYIANYEKLVFDYTSVSGESIPIQFYITPDKKEEAQNFRSHLINYVKIIEDICGPFPFRSDKIAFVQCNWGMEHQSAIACGSNFEPSKADFGIHFFAVHEFSHEWWGNLVTAKNWRDCWIHEGFATYMEALVVERLNNIDFYHMYSEKFSQDSDEPLVPNEDVTVNNIFNGDHSVYLKGAAVLHNLRYFLGDELFFTFIRRCAYPDPELEKVTDGSQCRLTTTDEIIEIANKVAGKDISWYFNTILKYAEVPVLEKKKIGKQLLLEWKAPNNLPYNMPIDIQVNGVTTKVEFTNNKATLNLSNENDYITFDPLNWVMKKIEDVVGINENLNAVPEVFTIAAYPNPFNPETTIEYNIPESGDVKVEIYNLLGQKLTTLEDTEKEAGTYKIIFSAESLSSGIYICKITSMNKCLIKKLLILK